MNHEDENKVIMNSGETSVMTVKAWLITYLLLCIPVANIILLFVWAFGGGNENRRNFARASLIAMAVGVILYIVLLATVFAQFLAAV